MDFCHADVLYRALTIINLNSHVVFKMSLYAWIDLWLRSLRETYGQMSGVNFLQWIERYLCTIWEDNTAPGFSS